LPNWVDLLTTPGESPARTSLSADDDSEFRRPNRRCPCAIEQTAARRSLSVGSFNEGDAMNALKMAAIVLIAAGFLGLLYGSLSSRKR
jgi:hypothetical protein